MHELVKGGLVACAWLLLKGLQLKFIPDGNKPIPAFGQAETDEQTLESLIEILGNRQNRLVVEKTGRAIRYEEDVKVLECFTLCNVERSTLRNIRDMKRRRALR